MTFDPTRYRVKLRSHLYQHCLSISRRAKEKKTSGWSPQPSEQLTDTDRGVNYREGERREERDLRVDGW